jgi:transglutaminase-like putative cysteine protease
MTVNCAEALLWRSQVYDRYTGRGWMSTMPVGEQPELIASPGQRQSDSGPDRFPSFPSCFSLPADAESLERQHTRRVDQVITVTGGRITSIHGAAEPVFAAFRGPQMLLSASGRVSFRIPYSKGASYAVSSTVSAATPRELRSASTVYPRDVEDRYLQVPDSCRQIEPTLRELVGAMPTNYDKVVAIRNYLEANFVYDLTAPAAPPDEDAVVHFLLRSRRGYCDVFASSMAVMCRLSDIPSRVAVGFASGRRGPDDDVYHVRQRDRHAWVEVFFPGYGWITFDPAPQEAGTSLVSRLRSAWHAMVDAVAARSNSFWVLALLFCLIGYLVKVEGIDRMMRARRNATRSRASVGRAAENYRRMCDTFARLGYPRPISMTPREYCVGLEAVLTSGCESLVPVVHAVTTDFIETRYARRDLPFDRVTLTSTLLSDLVREVRRAARQRLLGETGELRG